MCSLLKYSCNFFATFLYFCKILFNIFAFLQHFCNIFATRVATDNLAICVNLRCLSISEGEEDDGAVEGRSGSNNYVSFPALATSRSYAEIAYRDVPP